MKKIIIIFGLLSSLVVLIYLGSSYISPYTLLSKVSDCLSSCQIIGIVNKKIKRVIDEDGCSRIILTDLENGSVNQEVLYCEALPPNIDHAEKIVAVGVYNTKSQIFIAHKLLYKCPSKYQK